MNPCITTHESPLSAGTKCPREIHAHKADGTILTGVCVTEYLLERNFMWQDRAFRAEAQVESFKRLTSSMNERERDLHDAVTRANTKADAATAAERRRYEEAVSISKSLDAERTARRRAEEERDEYRGVLRRLGRILGPNPAVERIWVRVQRLVDEVRALRERHLKLEDELASAKFDTLNANLRAFGKVAASFGPTAAFSTPPCATQKTEAEDPRHAGRFLTVEALWRRFYAFADAVVELVSAGEAAVFTGKDDPARKASVGQTIIDLAANERSRRQGRFEVPPLPPAPAPGWRVDPSDGFRRVTSAEEAALRALKEWARLANVDAAAGKINTRDSVGMKKAEADALAGRLKALEAGQKLLSESRPMPSPWLSSWDRFRFPTPPPVFTALGL